MKNFAKSKGYITTFSLVERDRTVIHTLSFYNNRKEMYYLEFSIQQKAMDERKYLYDDIKIILTFHQN